MPERKAGRQIRSREQYVKPYMAGVAGDIIAKSDLATRLLPRPFSTAVKLTQIPKIPENSIFVSSYGADIAGPFALYNVLRLVGANQATAITVSLGIPLLFEAIEYAGKAAQSQPGNEARYDPWDIAAYVASVAGAVALDNYNTHRTQEKILKAEEAQRIAKEPRSLGKSKRSRERMRERRK